MSIKKTIRLFALVIVLAAFFFFIHRNLRQMDWRAIEWNGWALACSLLLLQVGFAMNALALQPTFRLLGVRVSLKTAYTVFFISNLGRYIPGRVWQVLSTGYFAKRHGIPFSRSVWLFAFNQAICITVNLTFAFAFIGTFPGHVRASGLVASIPFVAVLVVLARPNSFVELLNGVFRFVHAPAVNLKISRAYTWMIFAIYLVSILLMGAGFMLLVVGLGLDARKPLQLLATCPVAYSAGYLSMITPGGIGVREGVVVGLMKTMYTAQESSLIGLATLIWILLIEALNSGFALWLSGSTLFGTDGESQQVVEPRQNRC